MRPLIWWITLFAGYLGLVTTVSATEVVVGAAAASGGTAAACATRRALFTGGGSHRPRGDWLRWAAPLPMRVVTDLVRLARHGARGEYGEVRPPRGTEGGAALIISAAPGAYVVGEEPDRGALIVHRVGTPSRMERRIEGGDAAPARRPRRRAGTGRAGTGGAGTGGGE